MKRITLARGHEGRIKRGHPWIYRNEIERFPNDLADGEICCIEDSKQRPLGMGLYAAEGTIAVQQISDRKETIDEAFLVRRLERAREHRLWLGHDPQACRMVHAEGDGLSGLIVDAYGPGLVYELRHSGWRAMEPMVRRSLERVFSAKWMIEAGSADKIAPEAPALPNGVPEEQKFKEGKAEFLLRPGRGQKTGWFLDQKANRGRAAELSRSGRVLDLFCYEGAFAVRAALAGAERVIGIEISAEAANRARRQAEANGVADRCEFIEANAFDWLSGQKSGAAGYDLAWLDPPAFTKSRRSLDAAVRGYKEINLRAIQALRSGGILVTSSCSHHMAPGLFRDIVAKAASDAHRRLRLIAETTQDTDHVIDPAIHESQYLKCLFLRVDEW